ncbi:MAG: hypothetical protein MUD02_11645 [Bacteroidales bacterium]|nr:hypothetical protein [Bacteroidales bacterium]
MKAATACAGIFLMIFISACNWRPAEEEFRKPSFSTYSETADTETAVPVKNIIFYGVLTPVEISAIFDRLGIPFNSAALNPVTNRDLYLSSSKTAINTGIYGVDLGYLKMFGVGQDFINYLDVIRSMTYNLGIPEDIITLPVERIQGSLSDVDTIMAIVNTAYNQMDEHLRSTGRESTAGLIIMGGWVEALFLSTQLVYDPAKPDPQVVQKIAEQKYTLNALISLLKNYYDDPVVVYYSKKLKYLKRYFDSYEISYRKDDLEIDLQKQVLLSSGSEMTVTTDILNSIRDYVNKLRTEMVTP